MSLAISTEEVELCLILALLTRTAVTITSTLPPEDAEDIEIFASFIKAITDKSTVKVENSRIVFAPGTFRGGDILFNCQNTPIGYFIYYILPIVGYSKLPTKIVFQGVTNKSEGSASRRRRGSNIDTLKSVFAKIYRAFGGVAEIKINKRSFYPSPEGEVVLVTDRVATLNSLTLTKKTQLSRIININYSSRIGSDLLNKITNYNRDTLKEITPHVKVYNDIGNRTNTGASPGHGVLLVADGESGVYFGEECVDGDPSRAMVAEERERVPEKVVRELLTSIQRSGSFDYKAQSFLFVLLSLSRGDISSVVIRRIDRAGRETLALLKTFLNYTYKLERYSRDREEVDRGVDRKLLVFKSYGAWE